MFDNNKIFKFINRDSNDILSDFSGIELQELIRFLDKYYIDLRDNIGISEHITFGLEIEIEHTNWSAIEKALRDLSLHKEWDIKRDGSLTNGIEVNSPILKDNKKTWEDLSKICNCLDICAKIDEHSGGHIHVGRNAIEDNIEVWLNFIKLWAVYENIIYRFAYGEYLNARPILKKYSSPISDFLLIQYKKFTNRCNSIDELINVLSSKSCRGVNFNHINCGSVKSYDTFEFRCPNGTLNPIIWQNNVNFFVKLLLYSNINKYNDDIVNKRFEIIKSDKNNLKLYKEIYLEQALELADMIFTNNLDKINFLKQYLKSFKVSNNNIYTKSPKLTKKSRI